MRRRRQRFRFAGNAADDHHGDEKSRRSKQRIKTQIQGGPGGSIAGFWTIHGPSKQHEQKYNRTS